MEEEDHSSPPLRILDRIFAVGHEPVGVRVTPYHKPYAIRQILNDLDPEEVDTIRGLSFGKLLEIGEKPSFSGRFGHFHNLQAAKSLKQTRSLVHLRRKTCTFFSSRVRLCNWLNCRKLPKHTKKKSQENYLGKTILGGAFWDTEGGPRHFCCKNAQEKNRQR
ncbi:unnamed protein product [Brassica rapa subsp. narinosa]